MTLKNDSKGQPMSVGLPGSSYYPGTKYHEVDLINTDNKKFVSVSNQVDNGNFIGEDMIRDTDTIFLVESELDRVAAIQHGFVCVSPVCGRFRNVDWQHILSVTQPVTNIYIAISDKTDLKDALTAAEAFWKVGKAIKILQLSLPDGSKSVALNDLLNNHGAGTFQAQLPKARTLPDILIDNTKQIADMSQKYSEMNRIFALLASTQDEYLPKMLLDDGPKRLGISKAEWDKELKSAQSERIMAERQEQLGGQEDRIITNNRQLRDIAADALSAICRRNQLHPSTPVLYKRDGKLVRISLGTFEMQMIERRALLAILGDAAMWVKEHENDDGEVRTESVWPPHQVIDMLLGQSDWPGLPALESVVHSPVFDEEGQLHIEPGYNPQTKQFYADKGLIIGDTEPTPERLAWAKQMILDELLGEFPFKDDASRAHAVALALLPFVRKLIRGATPLHLIDSPTPGSGKGLLTDACALPFLGEAVHSVQSGRDDEEWRKRITATILAGYSHVSIDNICVPLDSGVLASALTQEWLEDRILGASRMVRMKVRTVWCANGNNVQPSDEIARRTVWIRLDANVERPWERKGFRHKDLRAWAKEHRNDLVMAVLTIIRAWVEAGMTRGDYTKGSYDQWAQVMGGILDTAGIPGFLSNERELFESAVDSNSQLKAFVEAWHEEYGTNVVGPGELFRLASHPDIEKEGDEPYLGLLDSLLGAGNQHSRKIKLGNALQKQRDKTIGEFKIVQAGIRGGQKLWQLQRFATIFTTGQNQL